MKPVSVQGGWALLLSVAALAGDQSVVAQQPAMPDDATLRSPVVDFLNPGDSLAGVRPHYGDRFVPKPEEPMLQPDWPAPEGRQRWTEWPGLTGDWGGRRSSLRDAGLDLGGNYTFDLSVARRRGIARGLLDLNFTFDPKPSLGIEDGQLFAQYFFRHGPHGSDCLGDVEGFDNMDAARLSQVEEFWYEQRLLGDRLRVKVGQVDANAEFDFVEAAGDFLNSSAGFSPTAAGFPTYPDPRLSVNVFIYPAGDFYVGAGVYGKSTSGSGDFSHPYWIAEVGVTKAASERAGGGRVALGVWRESATLDRWDDSRQRGAIGWYALAEQQVWREDARDPENSQGLTVFAQYGFGDGRVSPFVWHTSAGLVWVGMISGRDDDSAGLRVSCEGLSRETGSDFERNETSVECYYRFQATPAFSLQPDVQWFHNVGGQVDTDAVAGTVRAVVNF